MKKTLLFACVACAMAANAQSVKHNLTATGEVTFDAPAFNVAAPVEKVGVNTVISTEAKSGPQKVAVCDGADDSHSVFGTYFEVMQLGENLGALDVHAEKEVVDGTTYVLLSGLYRGFGQEVYGVYDEAAKTITVEPDQFVGTYDNDGQELFLYLVGADAAEEDGSFYIRGEADEEGNITELYPLVYTVKEDEAGSVYLELEGGWALYAADGNGEDASFLGYFVFGEEEMCNKANYVAEYFCNAIEESGWTGWQDQQVELFCEPFEESIMVYGFRGQYCFEIGLDPVQHTCTLANQDVWYYTSQNITFKINGCTKNDKYLDIPEDDDFYISGQYDPQREYLAFYQGEDDAQYFYIASIIDYEEGRGYFDSGIGGLQIYSKCGEIGMEYWHGGEGINTVLAPNAKSARYNLAGQRTNTYVKGINIENGKKVVR